MWLWLAELQNWPYLSTDGLVKWSASSEYINFNYLGCAGAVGGIRPSSLFLSRSPWKTVHSRVSGKNPWKSCHRTDCFILDQEGGSGVAHRSCWCRFFFKPCEGLGLWWGRLDCIILFIHYDLVCVHCFISIPHVHSLIFRISALRGSHRTVQSLFYLWFCQLFINWGSPLWSIDASIAI